MNEQFLEAIIAEIKKLNTCEQLALMTVFAKDLIEYIATNALVDEGTAFFQTNYTASINSDRYYWQCRGGELFQSIRGLNPPHNYAFARDAMSNRFDTTGLPIPIETENEEGDIEVEIPNPEVLDKEWLRYPGWALVRTFQTELKASPEDGCDVLIAPYLGNGSEAADTLALSRALLNSHFSDKQYWYPFVALLSCLLIKSCRD